MRLVVSYFVSLGLACFSESWLQNMHSKVQAKPQKQSELGHSAKKRNELLSKDSVRLSTEERGTTCLRPKRHPKAKTKNLPNSRLLAKEDLR